ncbi:VWA domain-containing protein [uncultured Clostridium sp.]|uniref:VWA domain-containing protein n=1 Tax=uncultured Clostridium sp. TaxID=59620 RepID=UPI0028EC001B|nr:VWA domain-containing protein [uncultured Clostridium sp.]
MNAINRKRKFLKRISLIVGCVTILALASSSQFKAKADVPSKPQFTVTIDSYTPSNPNPMVGEDITIHGTIHPQQFQVTIPPKEIVLVLDSSGSMGDNSKLTKLRAAAINFIKKMSAVKKLKIAIIDFDTQATIRNKLVDVSVSSNVNALINSINNLAAEGGTNTGEGLRQAAYILSNSAEQNPAASKNIVFMSDGEPTYYNWQTANEGWIWGNYSGTYYTYYNWLYGVNYGLDSEHMPSGFRTGPYAGNYTGYKYEEGSYNDYYTDITQSNRDDNVSIKGTGSSDNDGKCLNYAEAVGGIIKDQGYNVFSIGYGLDSDGNAKMQKIHNSMSTNNSNFYKTDTGAIDGVFNAIGDTIIDNYPITNVNFNFTPDADNSVISVNGNTVRLPDFSYKEVGRSNDGATVTYSADSVPFTLTIKSNISGNDIPVFSNSTITFPWQSDIVSARVPTENISVDDNRLPNINAILQNSKITLDRGNAVDEIDVKYTINTEQFTYNIGNPAGGMITNAVFVVDLSNTMSQGNRWSLMQNWFTNILLNDGNNGSDNTLKGQDIKFGVVGYNDSVKYPTDNGTYDRLFNRNNASERETLRQLFQNNIMVPQATTSRNIGPALEKADDLLQNKGDANANKAIILVNAGNVNYSQSDLNEIKNRGYKIISIDMSCDSTGNSASNLSSLHSGLSGNDNDYFKSKNDGGNFNSGDIDMQNVADRLKAGISPKNLYVNDAKLHFNLGDNFEAIEDGKLSGTGKLRTITLPSIKYTYNSQISKWQQTEPQPLEVTFKIKLVNGANGTSFSFGNKEENTISYTNFGGIITTKLIDTPLINIIGITDADLHHGLYNGIENGKPTIDENEKTFAKNSVVPLVAYAEGAENGDQVSLEIAEGVNIVGDIIVYEINSDGGLRKLSIMPGGNGNYNCNISNISDSDGKILILYNENLPENSGEYTNAIKVGAAERPAKLKVGDELPDLF